MGHKPIQFAIASISFHTLNGGLILISVLIVPKLIAPVWNSILWLDLWKGVFHTHPIIQIWRPITYCSSKIEAWNFHHFFILVSTRCTENCKFIAFTHRKLLIVEVDKFNVCGRPLFTNPVTFEHVCTSFPVYLQGLTLVHPITNDKNFHASVPIGADYYWQFIQNHVVRDNEPTAVQSWLGFLLSGPLPLSQPAESTNPYSTVSIISCTTKVAAQSNLVM